MARSRTRRIGKWAQPARLRHHHLEHPLSRACSAARTRPGEDVPDELLAHVSPTAWEHVNLAGNYSWQSTHRGDPGQLRPLREKLPMAA